MRIWKAIAGTLMALSGLATVTAVRAETVNCTAITNAAIPYTISAPGVYCVTEKITTNLATGAAIIIDANNVVLDLNGFAIGNLGAGAATGAVGVYAVDRQNIWLRNGILRGFSLGVALLEGTSVGLTTANSSGHMVSNIIADHCYAVGIAVQGPYAVVKNSAVYSATGSNNATGGNTSAISVDDAPGGIVSDNDVLDTDCSNACPAATAQAIGIEIGSSPGSLVSNNRITNSAMPTITRSAAIAVDKTDTNILLVGNVMANWATGITFSSLASGKYRFNGFIGGVTTNVTGASGVDAGDNY